MENINKKTLKLTLNVIENRDASFGSSKEMPLSGSTCTCTCTCCGSKDSGDDQKSSAALE